MRRILAAISAFAFSLSVANAATFFIPGFTLTGPPSTGATCVATAVASGLASAAPAGTVIFNCTVAPVGWVGIIPPITDPALTVTSFVAPGGTSAATFNLSLIAAGVVQTYPSGTGTLTP